MANLDHMLPYDYNKTQKAESMKYIAKWEPTGLLEGLDDKREKPHLAVLLENQARQIVTEANRTGTASNSEEWAGVALPLVRRIFSSIAAKDFVSIQPMNLPSGLVFFLDFKYGTSQPGFFANQGKNKDKPFRSRIVVDKKEIQLGMFSSENEAHEAYLQAKRKYHEGCTI